MTTAFETALAANDHEALRRLYGYEQDLRRRIELERDGITLSIVKLARESAQAAPASRPATDGLAPKHPTSKTASPAKQPTASPPPKRKETEAIEIDL